MADFGAMHIDVKATKASLARIQAELESIDATIKANIDDTQLKAEAEAAEETLKANPINVPVDVDRADLEREMTKAAKSARRAKVLMDAGINNAEFYREVAKLQQSVKILKVNVDPESSPAEFVAKMEALEAILPPLEVQVRTAVDADKVAADMAKIDALADRVRLLIDTDIDERELRTKLAALEKELQLIDANLDVDLLTPENQARIAALRAEVSAINAQMRIDVDEKALADDFAEIQALAQALQVQIDAGLDSTDAAKEIAQLKEALDALEAHPSVDLLTHENLVEIVRFKGLLDSVPVRFNAHIDDAALLKEIAKAEAAAERAKILFGAGIRDKELAREIEKARKALSIIKAQISPELNTAEFQAEMARLEAQLDSIDADIGVDVNDASLAQTTAKINEGVDSVEANVGVDVKDRELAAAVAKIKTAMTGLNANLGAGLAGASGVGLLAGGKTAALVGAAGVVANIGVAAGGTAAAFGLSTSAATGFNAELGEMKAISEATEEEMAALSAQALDLGESSAFGAKELAAGQTELLRAGLTAQQVVDGALEATVDLAASSAVTMEEAGLIVAKTMTVFGLAAENSTHVADVIAAAANKSAIDVNDMARGFQRAGNVAATVGVTFEETAAFIAAFGQSGVPGQNAGTSIKRFLQLMVPTSKEAAKAMKELGVTFFDAQGNFAGLEHAAGELQRTLGDAPAEERIRYLTEIFGSDAAQAAALLVEQGAGGIANWISMVDDAGYAADVATDRMDNLQGDLTLLGNSFETMLIKAGQGSQAGIREIVQGLDTFVDGLAPVVSAMAAPVVDFLGIVANDLLPVLIPGFEAMGRVMDRMNQSFIRFIDGWTQSGALDAALGFFEQLGIATFDFLDAVGPGLAGFVLVFTDLADFVLPAVVSLGESVGQSLGKIFTAMRENGGVEKLGEAFEQLVLHMGNFVEAIASSGAINALFDVFSGIVILFTKLVGPLLEPAAELFALIATEAAKLGPILEPVATVAGNAAAAFIAMVKDSGIVEFAGDVASALAVYLMPALGALQAGFLVLGELLKGPLSAAFDFIIKYLSDYLPRWFGFLAEYMTRYLFTPVMKSIAGMIEQFGYVAGVLSTILRGIAISTRNDVANDLADTLNETALAAGRTADSVYETAEGLNDVGRLWRIQMQNLASLSGDPIAQMEYMQEIMADWGIGSTAAELELKETQSQAEEFARDVTVAMESIPTLGEVWAAKDAEQRSVVDALAEQEQAINDFNARSFLIGAATDLGYTALLAEGLALPVEEQKQWFEQLVTATPEERLLWEEKARELGLSAIDSGAAATAGAEAATAAATSWELTLADHLDKASMELTLAALPEAAAAVGVFAGDEFTTSFTEGIGIKDPLLVAVLDAYVGGEDAAESYWDGFSTRLFELLGIEISTAEPASRPADPRTDPGAGWFGTGPPPGTGGIQGNGTTVHNWNVPIIETTDVGGTVGELRQKSSTIARGVRGGG